MLKCVFQSKPRHEFALKRIMKKVLGPCPPPKKGWFRTFFRMSVEWFEFCFFYSCSREDRVVATYQLIGDTLPYVVFKIVVVC